MLLSNLMLWAQEWDDKTKALTQIQTLNCNDHDSDHDNEDYSQPNPDDDRIDEDELSLDDILQEKVDQLNKDPYENENRVHSAASCWQY